MFQEEVGKAEVLGRRKSLIKKVMMGTSCCSNGRNKKSTENFGQEACWIAATSKTKKTLRGYFLL
jgi:hypothetical protein